MEEKVRQLEEREAARAAAAQAVPASAGDLGDPAPVEPAYNPSYVGRPNE
jgi:hypothetical protein